MKSFRNKYVAGPLALLVALVVTTSIALTSGGVAASSSSSAPAASAQRQVAHTGQGELRTRIVGETANGRRVTGYFTPLRFSRHDGKLFMRAVYHGVVHNSNGTTRTFDAIRTKRVRPAIAGAAATRAQAAAAPCRVLNLVLGPLHLDLLGLVVDLNRVVLNIVAQSGAGNLLGNLVCALAGLLDGGLSGLLGRITNLLNRILTRLGLGI